MKYKEIVDIIKNTCLNNFFINEFSYGNISDINTPDDEEPVNYPYAFLNPINITNDGVTSTFNANLIIMTQTYDTLDEELQQQSNCINYLEQIIGKINKNLDNPQVEFITPFSVTPFKERFSDNVVGATAGIAIQYPSNITDCDTPYSGVCDNYLNICATNTFPSNLAGTYKYYKNAVLIGVGGITFDIQCGGNIAFYTGTTTNNSNSTILAAWDVNGDGSLYQWQFGEVVAGTLGCNERIDFTPTALNVSNTISCLAVEYPDISNDPPLNYGKCQ
jgi:hypothetical protein